MTVHVAHLVTSFDMGGLQNGIVNIVNASDPRRVRHTVLAMRNALQLGDRLRQGDALWVGLEPGRRPFAYRTIAKALDRLVPDVLHTRNWGTYPDGILAARRSRVKGRVHGHHGRDLHNAAGERWRRRVIGCLLGRATDRIIALTPAMRREYARDFWVQENRITVIPNGVDLERLARFAADPALRSTFTVVAVGRLDPVKNYPMLVEAFARLTSRQPSDRLVIAGEGPERARIVAAAARAGVTASVTLLGERPDAPSVIKSADVFVQPSFYEGMSNTVVEAMACGIPVVATDVGGNGDVTGRDGAAVLVPSDDPAALAAALERLRGDAAARQKIGEAGRRRALEHFGLETMVEAYSRVYEDVAAEHGGAAEGDPG